MRLLPAVPCRTLDAAEADSLRLGVMQDFDGIPIEDGDDGAGEVCTDGEFRQKRQDGN